VLNKAQCIALILTTILTINHQIRLYLEVAITCTKETSLFAMREIQWHYTGVKEAVPPSFRSTVVNEEQMR